MATIEKMNNKGGASYRITVYSGYDCSGKRIRHRTTYKPAPGMTARQIEKAVQRAAADFERSIEQGYILDNRQTFVEYAQYVLDMKERNGLKHRTLARYKELMIRINEAIGHMKLVDIRPQHINGFYRDLMKPGVRISPGSAVVKMDLAAYLKEVGLSRAEIGRRTGLAAATVGDAVRGKSVYIATATAIAKALGKKAEEVFELTEDSRELANKTVIEYHRLIRMILGVAEKEMLVPYNAAAKASPPRSEKKEPNYFQPEMVAQILLALESEPIKWQAITHLFIVTGGRRGEVAAIKWEKLSFENNTVRIDRNLQYIVERGIYEDSTKNRSIRELDLPQETMDLLRQHRAEQLRLQLANGDRWQQTGYVFTQENGLPMNPSSITGWMNDFANRHGLQHINPHAFRHTVASVLLANGLDLVTVARQLGHLDVATTGKVYSHIIEEAKAKAAKCITDVMLRKKA